MTKLLFAASAAALLTVAGHVPAMAQSSASGMSAPMITCRDLSAMDRDMARSVVFYLSGFQAAADSSTSAAATGSSDTSGASGTSSTADAGSSGTTGTAGSSDSASSDVTGSTSAAGSSDTSGTAASGTSSTTGTSGASGAVVTQLPGFSSVDIDKIMADCQNSPDRQLSEMLGTSTSGSGSTTTP